jgi:flagellar basal-body rod protein FlgF
MIPGLYSAATAMDVTDRRQEVVAENLANLQTPGYRRRVLSQASFDSVIAPLQIQTDGVSSSRLLGAQAGDTKIDFTQGHLEQTGVKLHAALNGDGFFVIQGPNGPLYTRSGAFHADPQATIVNIDGLPVKGTNGPLTLPPGASSSQVEITSDGSVYVNEQRVGQLELVDFADKNVLQPEGSSLFSAPPGAVTTGTAAEVMQGSLEMANTSSVDQLVNMIEISRHHDAAQRALTAISDSLKKRIEMGL